MLGCRIERDQRDFRCSPERETETEKPETTPRAEPDANHHLTIYNRGWHAFTDPKVTEQGVNGARYDLVLDRPSRAAAAAFLAETLAA